MIVQQRTTAGDALVSAAIQGDRRAISALWHRHRRWVAAVLLAHKPAEADLEDLLQEVAMRLVSKVDTLREESNLRAWLRAVAVNVARSAARRRPMAPADLEDSAAASVDAPDFEQDERTRSLMQRLNALPALYREPLMLRAVQGMRTKQIAATLDLAPATIDTRIARARRMLLDSCRELLSGDRHGEQPEASS
ncbi:MAG: RNA polymerase sigma factor [Planctomycetota bacterium]